MARQEPHQEPELFKELPNLAEQVFQIDLIREMILKNAVIEDKDKKICWSSVHSLRLVQKSWLETVTKLFQMAKKPLFHLVLEKENSLIEHVGEEEGKLLNQFVNAVTSGFMSTGPSVPAFTLKISYNVFVQENRPSFSKILFHCGSGLVELKLDLSPDGGTFKLMFPTFSLPNLRKLTIYPGSFYRNDNVSHFVNTLLNAAPGLTHFLVGYCDDRSGPMDLQCFTLPDSITTVELDCYLANVNFEMLINNSLPQLTTLTLFIPHDETFPDGLLFRILDKFRKTLRKLELTHLGYFRELNDINLLGFPVMEELVEFSNSSLNCQLEADMRSLATLLPKLSRLTLAKQTIDSFRRWTENCFRAVLQLAMHLGDENFYDGSDDFAVGLNLERMQRLHTTFPNVRKLDVTIRSMETCRLEYLFREMRQLTELGIDVVDPDRDLHAWDAVLIGAPIKFVEGLRESPQFWKDVQLTNHLIPSIKNLQELTSLCLNSRRVREDRYSLISNLTFRFALLKMPKLKELTLKGGFFATDKMKTIWLRQGRKLVED